MPRASWGAVVRQFDRLLQSGAVAGLDEVELLERFLTRRDEVAFAAIVERYGPMVLSVCRDMIIDSHDVEDAFQATFLVLVRRARDLRRRDQLGSWLHGVARRVAMRARAVSARKRDRVHSWDVAQEPICPAPSRGAGEELRPLIREEVDRLPARYRDAVVLCYFEGRTHEEAAMRLGWPLGTVKGRLARAREQLRTRLERRGFDATSLSVGLALSTGRPAVPTILQSRTVAAALAYSASGTTTTALSTTIISTTALQLAHGVLPTMMLGTTQLAAFGLLATGLLAIPAVLAGQSARETRPTPTTSSAVSPRPDKLPEGSAGIGVASSPTATSPTSGNPNRTAPFDLEAFPTKLQAQATRTYEEGLKFYKDKKLPTQVVLDLARRSLSADLRTAGTRTDRDAALNRYLQRCVEILATERARHDIGAATTFDVELASLAEMEAHEWVAGARANSPSPALDPDAVSTSSLLSQTAGSPIEAASGLRPNAVDRSSPNSEPPTARAPISGFGIGPASSPPNSSVAGRAEQASTLGLAFTGSGTSGGSSAAPTAKSPAVGGPTITHKIPAGAIATGPNTGIAPPTSLAPTARQTSPPRPTASDGGGYLDGGMMPGGMTGPSAPSVASDPDSEKLTESIRRRLEERVAFNFPNETPLEEVLKHIKEATKNTKLGHNKGIPIYLDPMGLAEAEKTPTSTITLDLEDVPLRMTLRLMLDQLGLAYRVHDGVLIISTLDRLDQLSQP